jgi:MFS family permease
MRIVSSLFLGFVAACFPAVSAVVLAVFSEAHPIIRLANGAILDAIAAILESAAYSALEFLVTHGWRLSFRTGFLVAILTPGANKIKPRTERGRRERAEMMA